MKKLVITSKNPVKREATILGFQKMFPGEKFEIESISVSSDVPDQPYSSDETLQGAINRVENARKIIDDANFWIGIEGGVRVEDSALVAFGWIVIRSRHTLSKSQTGTFVLPPAVQKLLEAGNELGDAMDKIFHTKDSKQNSGAIGLLTDGIITRQSLYEHAVILALVPFKNQGFR